MRALILAAGAAFALAACGNKGQTGGNQNGDESLTAQNIVSNDVTAIDAVTGDAANMAADVNYTELENTVANDTGGGVPARPKRSSPKPAAASAAPAENAVTTAPGNATE